MTRVATPGASVSAQSRRIDKGFRAGALALPTTHGYARVVGRTVWIGDVHGCADELEELLGRLAVGAGDRVVFVGDLVARGPDSRRVLRIARELGALAVRGNHEQRVLAAHAARSRGERPPRLGPAHQRLLTELGPEDWEQLEALPLSLEFPEHGVRVVHAGVVPGVPFEEQQPWALLHIRSLTALGAASDRYSASSWALHYEGPPHVVFGHNAQAGLQLAVAATGLDTGCVYGGELTAMVLREAEAPPPPAERRDVLTSVPARRRYVDYGPRPARAS